MEHCGTLSSYWRKYGTIMTLPRTGHPSEIDEVTKKDLVGETSKRQRAT